MKYKIVLPYDSKLHLDLLLCGGFWTKGDKYNLYITFDDMSEEQENLLISLLKN